MNEKSKEQKPDKAYRLALEHESKYGCEPSLDFQNSLLQTIILGKADISNASHHTCWK